RRLRPLRAVLGAALLATVDAHRVQRAANDVVTHAREILHAAAADQHDRVLLQVVADARDVGGHLDAVGQPHASHLAQRGVRLLRRLGVHADTDAPLLRGPLKGRSFRLVDDLLAPLAHQLMNRRHTVPISVVCPVPKFPMAVTERDGSSAAKSWQRDPEEPLLTMSRARKCGSGTCLCSRGEIPAEKTPPRSREGPSAAGKPAYLTRRCKNPSRDGSSSRTGTVQR